VLLVLDVGNTQTVVGLFRDAGLPHQWRIASDRNRTCDELRLLLGGLLGEAGIDRRALTGAAVASVVPSLNEPLHCALSSLGVPSVRFLTPATSPLLLDVTAPETVGADRIANCLAAHALVGGPALVLDFGTATTFDLVGEDGRFLGGAIAPEMALTARALTEHAAQLYAVELTVPASVIGKDTVSNLQAGVVLGFLDLISGLIARFVRECGVPSLPVLATGGKGALFAEQLEAISRYEPSLTLHGLRLWWNTLVDGSG
jgi:type III pantothenate kinase